MPIRVFAKPCILGVAEHSSAPSAWLLWPAAGQAWIGQRSPAPPEVADALIGLLRGTS